MKKIILIYLGLILLSIGLVNATCTETDGGYDLSTIGTTTSTEGSSGMPAGSYTDACLSATELAEYACPMNSSTVVDYYYIDCADEYDGEGFCKEGSCGESTCEDSDCGEYVCDTSLDDCYSECTMLSYTCNDGYACQYSKSTCSVDADGDGYPDTCYDNTDCGPVTACDSTGACSTDSDGNGIADIDQNPSAYLICTDTDGSTSEYKTKGTVTEEYSDGSSSITQTDTCATKTSLIEYGCTNDEMTSTTIDCKKQYGKIYSCNKGMCTTSKGNSKAAEYEESSSLPWLIGAGIVLLLIGAILYWNHSKGKKAKPKTKKK